MNASAVTVSIYIDDGCGSCDRAVALAAEIRAWFPQVHVRIHDLAAGADRPASIVAVPAFLVDDRLVQYGTPSPEQIAAAIMDSLADRQR